MASIQPEDLKAFSEELERFKQDHLAVINAEPILKEYLDGAERYARKHYEDVKR